VLNPQKRRDEAPKEAGLDGDALDILARIAGVSPL
jgi:hypothetical protein